MPISILPQIFYRADYHESANEAVPERTAAESAYRLQRRYGNLDFEATFIEMCFYLNELVANETNPKIKMKHEAARRALYPKFGAVGANRRAVVCSIPNLEVAAYYWAAGTDTSADISSSVADRKACIARALYECQRGNNNLGDGYDNRNSAQINFIDNESPDDRTVCAKGVNEKFAEVMVGMHPDVDLLSDLQPRIFDLVKGFVAEYCYSIGKTAHDLIPSTNPAVRPDLDYSVIVPDAIKAEIKAKITKTLGVFGQNAPALMGIHDVKYLNDTLSYLEMLEFTFDVSVNTTEAKKLEEFKDYVAKLIADANQQLKYVNDNVVSRPGVRTLIFSAVNGLRNLVMPRFNVADISDLIKGMIPEPTNQCDLIVTDGFDVGFRTLQFGDNGDVQVRAAEWRSYNTLQEARVTNRVAARKRVGW
jgi:hypothetical protein